MTIEEAVEILKKYKKNLHPMSIDNIAYEKAIFALCAQQKEEKSTAKCYNAHEVAEILAEVTGDDCACNINGNDEWLPDKCELQSACLSPVGVACWEQYLKHYH